MCLEQQLDPASENTGWLFLASTQAFTEAFDIRHPFRREVVQVQREQSVNSDEYLDLKRMYWTAILKLLDKETACRRESSEFSSVTCGGIFARAQGPSEVL